MKVINVLGEFDSGKTNVLKYVYERLEKTGTDIFEYGK